MFIEDRQWGECRRATGQVILACCAFLGGVLLSAPLLAQEAPAADLATAIGGGDAGVELRYRFEHVDQDSLANAAKASTLRFRLNYASLPYRSFKGFIEFDYVAEVLFDDYNSGGGTSPNRTQYPVV
ncbi:MAG: hypothetical protein WBN23_14315, partial [Woeseia sp.]